MYHFNYLSTHLVEHDKQSVQVPLYQLGELLQKSIYTLNIEYFTYPWGQHGEYKAKSPECSRRFILQRIIKILFKFGFRTVSNIYIMFMTNHHLAEMYLCTL